MYNIISVAISSLCLVFSSMFIWNIIDRENKINYCNFKVGLSYFLCSFLITINYIYGIDFIKPVISTTVMIIMYKYLYNEKIINSIVLPIYSQLIIIISEFIYVACIVLFFNENEYGIKEQYFGSIITNISVSFISIIIASIPLIRKIYKSVLQITDSIKKHLMLIISFVLIVIANILTTYLYYKVNLFVLLIINTSIISIYTIFVFFYLKTNNNYIKVYDKYTITLNSLKEYEDILSRYRISNHENKNQLLAIRGMVKNKKVVSYIDEIIENKIKDNEKLMVESLVIPEGGLRGLIYSKMLLMKENNIDYDLCIDKKIKTSFLTSLPDDLNLSICNIVGVYLDNAIEAVKDLDEKYIVIEMYLEDNTLNIAITNNYENDINIENIDNVGYSTKGGNHGYGLSLVKEILDQNKNITNVRHISEDEFTQEIKIKY